MSDPFTLLPANLARVADVAGDQLGVRYNMTGIHVSVSDGSYIVCATDGRRLVEVRGQTEHDPLEFPTIEELVQASQAESAVIPAKEWRQVFKTAPRGQTVRRQPILGHVALHLGTVESILATTDGEEHSVQQVYNVEGKFPDYESAIPREEPQATVALNPYLMMSLLRVACEMTTEELSRVTLELRGPNKPLVLRAANAHQQFLGLLMPLTESEKANP